MRHDALRAYFTDGILPSVNSIGMEVETSFIDELGTPVSLATSQQILRVLAATGWTVCDTKNGLITALHNKAGDRLLYELGRQNIELATTPGTATSITRQARVVLDELYEAARTCNAYPFFAPVLATQEDLLVVPDERDATWIELDGRAALMPLATISSVQFTVEVSVEEAPRALSRLRADVDMFLKDYPQDAIWKTYIESSRAGYRTDRYGGPCVETTLDMYCRDLLEHDVVTPSGLMSHQRVPTLDLSLFVRSIWWYFRLRRYGDRLCIEVRPLPRRSDDHFDAQLALVLDSF